MNSQRLVDYQTKSRILENKVFKCDYLNPNAKYETFMLCYNKSSITLALRQPNQVKKEMFMEKLSITGFGTHIKVADIEKSRKFYESLGFKAVFAYGNDAFRASLPEGLPSAPEKYRGMTFNIGESGVLEIAEDHVAVKDKSVSKEVIKSPKVSAMVKVQSVVPLFTNPLVSIKFPVRHYYWGTVEVALRDPDGFVLLFIAPYSEEEIKQVSKYTKVEEIKPS